MKNYSVILNLTQHNASAEQIEAGVVDLPPSYREKLVELLTFNELPSADEVKKRAGAIYDKSHKAVWTLRGSFVSLSLVLFKIEHCISAFKSKIPAERRVFLNDFIFVADLMSNLQQINIFYPLLCVSAFKPATIITFMLKL
jgi:hypothetical protein